MCNKLVWLLCCFLFCWAATLPLQLAASEVDVGECKATYRHRVTVSVDRPGVIACIPEEGNTIQTGEIIVQLKEDVPQANLSVAIVKADNEALIRSEQKAAEAAKLEYDAAIEANRQSGSTRPAYSPTHIARLKLAWESAEWRVKAAEQEQRVNIAARDQARAELETYRIYSGIDGVVVQVFRHVGEVVQQGEPIAELINTDELRVEGFIRLEDAFRIKPGLPVTVTFNIPGESETSPHSKNQGKLGFVDVSVQTLSNRLRVWAIIPNPQGRLREGLPVHMKIHIP